MKRTFLALMMLLVVLSVSGCGDGDDDRTLVTREIESTLAFDGDIVFNSATDVFTVSQGFTSVFAGLDPVEPEESRAFLDFPLAGIPLNAVIQEATLDIVIKSVTVVPPSSGIPIRIELVSFSQPLRGEDHFSRVILPPLATTTIVPPISSADVNRSVPVDVTSLMREAQARKLSRFQLRILQDFVASPPGLIEIDDDVDPPLLIVDFF